LTNSLEPSEVVIGLIVSIVVSTTFTRYYSIKFDWKLPVRILRFVFIYLPVFIWEMIKANLDVAVRVLNPSLPLNPGFVKVKTSLKGKNSKLALANSITLTPGTLTLDVKDEELYIHWVDVKATSEEQKQKHITTKFEKILKKIFE
jgi:multicomponent Na+:H+ antiporter subunit E